MASPEQRAQLELFRRRERESMRQVPKTSSNRPPLAGVKDMDRKIADAIGSFISFFDPRPLAEDIVPFFETAASGPGDFVRDVKGLFEEQPPKPTGPGVIRRSSESLGFTQPSSRPEGMDRPGATPNTAFTNRMAERVEQNQLKLATIAAADVEANQALSEDESLSTQEREEAARRRDFAQQQLNEIHKQHAQLSVQKRHSEEAIDDSVERVFGPGGILPGASDEQLEALDDLLTGHFTHEDKQSFIDAVLNSNLSAQDKNERLDFVLDKATAQAELTVALDDLVAQRREFEILTNSTDVALLGSDLEYSNQELHIDLQQDPVDRTQLAFRDSLNAYWQVETGEDFPSNLLQYLDGDQGILTLALSNPGMIATPQFKTLVDSLAEASGNDAITGDGIIGALQFGAQLTQQRNNEWESALEQDNYQPYSRMLMNAIFQVAVGLVGEEQAALLAESADVHSIIAATSQGKTGQMYGGTKGGIGGLTANAYARVGYDPEETIGDPVRELEAFITYLIVDQGGATAAMQRWLRTGNWGD